MIYECGKNNLICKCDKKKLICEWEEKKESELECLFKSNLYPILRWVKDKEGINYSVSDIGTFKGIKVSNQFRYANYHRAINNYFENLNDCTKTNQYQLTQPILAGKLFFKWTLYYFELLRKIREEYNKILNNTNLVPESGTGNIYVMELFESALLLFADRFGLGNLDESAIKSIYTWAYSIRLEMYAVYKETIDKYARGKHERINHGINLFSKISEMENPNDIKMIQFEKIKNIKTDSFNEIYEKINEWNGWEN